MTDYIQPNNSDTTQPDIVQHRQLTQEEFIEKSKRERKEVQSLLDSIIEEVKSSPECFERYLSTQARLDRYSASNALLVYRQMPNATLLKTSDEWNKAGVNIRKGEKHITILAPKESKGKTYYDPKSVFDVSQTNGKRTPAPTLNNNPTVIIAAMLDTAPVACESVENFGFTDDIALYDNEKGVISVRKNVMDSVKLFQSVAVELAFAELSVNGDVFDRKSMTFDAVCIANMLCKKFGVPFERFTVTQLPVKWKTMQPKEIREEMNKNRAITSSICSRVSHELYRQRQDRQQGRDNRSRGDAR